MPDIMATVVVVRKGYGDMAISYVFGSNIFNVLVVLGLPWLLQTTVVKPGTAIQLYSSGKTSELMLLISSVYLLRRINLRSSAPHPEILIFGNTNHDNSIYRADPLCSMRAVRRDPGSSTDVRDAPEDEQNLWRGSSRVVPHFYGGVLLERIELVRSHQSAVLWEQLLATALNSVLSDIYVSSSFFYDGAPFLFPRNAFLIHSHRSFKLTSVNNVAFNKRD